MNSKQLGNFGEKIAQDYLRNKGYKILERNYSPKFVSGPKRGEIDIITQKKDVISFIEVKALQSRDLLPRLAPEMKVNYQKQRKIIKIAQSYLLERHFSLDKKWQIDVLAIEIDLNKGKAKIRHIENAVGG